MERNEKAKFNLGQLVATPGALEALTKTEESPLSFIARHISGDWGDIDGEDVQENEFALNQNLRLLSVYHLKDGTKIWIITEADRSATTILLPSEY
jgi:hypothetical protein